MKKYANERDEIVAEFKSFMNQAILNCARNVTRMINRRDEVNGGESLETLDEKRLGEYMATEDRHDVENGIELEITNVTIKINDELLRKLLAGLTEREVQSLVLHEAFDYDFQQIGEMPLLRSPPFIRRRVRAAVSMPWTAGMRADAIIQRIRRLS